MKPYGFRTQDMDKGCRCCPAKWDRRGRNSEARKRVRGNKKRARRIGRQEESG